jgi:putative hemolysin
MEPMPDILFNVSIILLLILLNGVFALAEIALVSARRARLKQMVQDGSRSAQVALDL